MTNKLATNLRTEPGGFCIKSLLARCQALYASGTTCSQKIPLQRRQNYGDFTDRNFWPDLVWDGSRQRLQLQRAGERARRHSMAQRRLAALNTLPRKQAHNEVFFYIEAKTQQDHNLMNHPHLKYCKISAAAELNDTNSDQRAVLAQR